MITALTSGKVKLLSAAQHQIPEVMLLSSHVFQSRCLPEGIQLEARASEIYTLTFQKRRVTRKETLAL